MALNFPAKIYQILENESADIIRWHSNGIAFRIVDHGRFEREIIPKYFRHNQLSSVQRQLNLYGFKCINRGEDKGAFFHPKFKRGDWEVVKKITRFVPTKKSSEDASTGGTTSNKDGDNLGDESEAQQPPANGVSTVTSQPTEVPTFQPVQLNVVDPFLQPQQHFNSFPHHKQINPYRIDPFSYVEASTYHSVPADYWHHWPAAQMHGGSAVYSSAPRYHSMKLEPEFSSFVTDFSPMKNVQSAPLTTSSKKSSSKGSGNVSPKALSSKNKVLEVVAPAATAATVASNNSDKDIQDLSKAFVFSVNEVVTIDPDFDLDDDFALFQDIDHSNAMVSDFHPSMVDEHVAIKAESIVATSKPKMQDACVNTDLTQSSTNIYDLYRICHPL